MSIALHSGTINLFMNIQFAGQIFSHSIWNVRVNLRVAHRSIFHIYKTIQQLVNLFGMPQRCMTCIVCILYSVQCTQCGKQLSICKIMSYFYRAVWTIRFCNNYRINISLAVLYGKEKKRFECIYSRNFDHFYLSFLEKWKNRAVLICYNEREYEWHTWKCIKYIWL